jgi:hypothetical protein
VNLKYPSFSKQVFERDSFRDIQPMPQHPDQNRNLNEKKQENTYIRDGDYNRNDYFSSKYA